MSLPEDLGKIQINDEVIAKIASMAAVEVDGIVTMTGGSSLSDLLGSKSSIKGVKVTTDEASNYAVIDIDVNVEYGFEIYKAAHQLQRAVKNGVEAMTGLQVQSVNVKICEIVGDLTRRPTLIDSPEVPADIQG